MQFFRLIRKVFSGHFHTRSNQDNISYLGNPYEIYWNDHEDTRGFHFFDTETLETTPDVTKYLLNEAGLAIVPFYAFGASKKSPWYRLSVGTSVYEEIDELFVRLKGALSKLK